MLSNKLFHIQLRKSSWGNSNNTHTTLSILSYVEKEQTLPPSTIDRNSKKIKPLGISEVEMMATTTAAGSSSVRPKFEPPTPTKRCKRSFWILDRYNFPQ
uniref:Putative ovule protein n=1 Tax=Solanum chacoense TaxID=4108 RepID=A0A0V0I034_SOLCH